MFIDAGFDEDSEKAGEQAKLHVQSVQDIRKAKGDALEEYRLEVQDWQAWAARALADNMVNWPETKAVRIGEDFVTVPENCDRNRAAAFDAIFGKGQFRPYFDLFRGRSVDHNGNVIDENYPYLHLVEAVAKLGMKNQAIRSVAETFRHWAREKKVNSLVERMKTKTPEWDGKPRIHDYICDTFHCNRTDLNLNFSKYFWLSLYCRIMFPGCQAPIALSLFGTQHAGKSYFSKLICAEVTGDRAADSVPLDLSGDVKEFLRNITGSSVVANVAEMVGFSRGDLNKIKSFMTRTSDPLDFKYENNLNQPRQWITIMDGNKYEGLQRDDTGNRRFYPMFVGQLKDRLGMPHWMEVFKIDFSNFTYDFWQIMAECKMFIDEHGLRGYDKVVDLVSSEVAAFSVSEKKNNRGTIEDKAMSAAFYDVISASDPVFVDGRKKRGIFIAKSFFYSAFRDVMKQQLNENRLKPFMTALGFVEDQIKNRKCFFLSLPDMTEAEALNHFKKIINSGSEDDEGIDLPEAPKDTGF